MAIWPFNRLPYSSRPVNNNVATVRNAIDNLVWSLQSVFSKAGSTFHRSKVSGNLAPNLKNSALYAGLTMYATVVPSLPRYMAKIDTATGAVLEQYRTTQHPACRIWRHNAGTNWPSDRLIAQIAVDVRWDGNFYALPYWNGQGQIVDLSYVHPSRIPSGAIKYAKGGEHLDSRRDGRKRLAVKDELIVDIASGDTYEESKSILLPYDELFHIPGPLMDPANHRGMGARDHALSALKTAGNAETFLSDFYESGIRKQMFLSTDKDISAPVIAQLEKLLLRGSDDENGGQKKPDWGDRDLGDIFRARILPHNLKPIFVGQVLQDLQFIETRAFSNEDIARFIQIPPGLLYAFMGQGATPDSLEGMLFNWFNTSLGPYLTWIGNAFRDAVLPVSSRPIFEFGFSRIHLLKTTPQSGSVTIRNLVESGIMTQEEGREVFGVRSPMGGETYVPANIITKKHSDLLAAKVEQTIKMGDVQIAKLEQDMKNAQQAHDALAANGFVPPQPPAAPGEDPTDGKLTKGEKPTPDNPPQDNRTKATKGQTPSPSNEFVTGSPNPKAPLQIAKDAFLNILDGLHDFELRYLKGKCKPAEGSAYNYSPEIRSTASTWIGDKFAAACSVHADRWQTLNLGFDPVNVLEEWILQSQDIVNNSPDPIADLSESHKNRIGALLQKEVSVP